MDASFTERLGRRIEGGVAAACIGLDPRVEALPAGLAADASPAERIAAFYRETIPVLARHVAVVKPNIAFFEVFGTAGWAAYEATCEMARDHDLLVIGDIKRGDIGSTAAAYAEAHYRLADAVTVQPWLGYDGVEPFVRHCRDAGKGCFVLVRTSNRSAKLFQGLSSGTGTVSDAVARAVERWGADTVDRYGYSAIGAVVGATWPEDIRRLRARMPHAWFLIPGVGAQGGTVEDCRSAFDSAGLGAVVNQSRGIMQAFGPNDPDWLERIEEATVRFCAQLNGLRATPPECPSP